MNEALKIKDIIKSNIKLHEAMLNDKNMLTLISDTSRACIKALQTKKKILICGNGGSAADAQHMAAEFVGRFQKERRGIASIALNTDTSVLTAWANDYDYDSVFERQVEALGNEGDILIGISTSGNSKNVLRAFEYAKDKGITTVGLLGKDGGTIKSVSDFAMIVPEKCTARVQEAQITIIHTICELIENAIYDEEQVEIKG